MSNTTENRIRLGTLLAGLIIVFPIIGYYLLRNIVELTLIIIFGAIFGLIFWFVIKNYFD